MSEVTVVDIMVVAVLLVSGGLAMWRGLVEETFTIIDWVAAGFVALRFTPTFQPLLREVISPSWLEYVVVFIGTFLLMFIPLSILNHRLSAAVRKSEIGPVDRVLGAVFGVGRGLVIVGVAYIAFTAMVPARDHPEALTKARFYPVIRQTSQILVSLIPGQSGFAALDPRAAASKLQAEKAPAEKPAEKVAEKTAEKPPAEKPAAEKPQVQAERAPAAAPRNRTGNSDVKAYGANDRRALDKLIEKTGTGQGPTQ